MTAATEPLPEPDLERASDEPDIHTTAGKLADLAPAQRRGRARRLASARSSKQHAKGKKTARERIDLLLDEGSFVELDELARHRSTNFGLEQNRPYGDGVVTGHGTVDGRPVCVFSQDVTVFGGALGEVYGEKIVKVMDLAHEDRLPRRRHQRGRRRAHPGGRRLARPLRRDLQPQRARVRRGPADLADHGPERRAAHVYSPALTDFVVMVDETSHMFITGPDVIKTVTGEDVGFEELGGARTHNTKSGNAHYLAADEDDAISYVKELLSLPAVEQPGRPAGVRGRRRTGSVPEASPTTDRELDTLIPDSPNQPYDMHEVITRVVDDGEFLEVHALFAPNMLVGFGRVEGRPVGHRRQPADPVRRLPRHRRLREGRAVRAHLRRVQHPGADLRRRARASCPAPTRSGTASSGAAPS